MGRGNDFLLAGGVSVAFALKQAMQAGAGRTQPCMGAEIYK